VCTNALNGPRAPSRASSASVARLQPVGKVCVVRRSSCTLQSVDCMPQDANVSAAYVTCCMLRSHAQCGMRTTSRSC
jgi:hypothetical protein